MLVSGGRLVDPRMDVDALRDLRIEGGLVVEVGEYLTPERDEHVVDARGAIVAPGFIDMHVHLREPGFPEKETIATGTEAAVRGGFTSIACMPNTEPPLDDAASLDRLFDLISRSGRCRVYPVAAITKARAGDAPCDYAALAGAGAVAFSDDGSTIMNARVLRDCARLALDVAGAFVSHAEDEHLKGAGVMNEGVVSREMGVAGSPALAEDVIVARDVAIAMETGKRWHIAHVSTRGALAAVLFARGSGCPVTCEVTPHHLTLTEETVRRLGAGGKVNPPLRMLEDARSLRDAVRDGTIDVLATDHAPHTAREKSGDLASAAVGFTGLEIAVGAYAFAVPDLPLRRFVEMLSCNPARILGIAGGTLAPGNAADVTIFAERPWVVDPASFASKGKSTPFAGRRFTRRAIATIVGGELRFSLEANG